MSFKIGDKVTFSYDIVEPNGLLSMQTLAKKGESGEVVYIIEDDEHENMFCVQTAAAEEFYVFSHEIEVVV